MFAGNFMADKGSGKQNVSTVFYMYIYLLEKRIPVHICSTFRSVIIIVL